VGGCSPVGFTRHWGHQNVLLCQPWVIMMMEKLVQWRLAGETRNTRQETCPSATLSTTNPTWLHPGSKPRGRRDWKPATNRLSYGAAFAAQYMLEGSTRGRPSEETAGNAVWFRTGLLLFHRILWHIIPFENKAWNASVVILLTVRWKRWHLANDPVLCSTLHCSLSPPLCPLPKPGCFLPFVSGLKYRPTSGDYQRISL
jgi:hypothetical protein